MRNVQQARRAPASGEGESDVRERAREIVLHQLTAAPRTRAQLSGVMLRRGIPEEVVEEVLGRFEEVNLIDDEQFARAWVDSRRTGRGLARRALAYELRQRGVDEATVDAAVGEIGDDEELEAARAVVRRRLPALSGDDPDRRVRRLAGVLARKGYGSAVAQAAIRAEVAVVGDALAVIDADDL